MLMMLTMRTLLAPAEVDFGLTGAADAHDARDAHSLGPS